MKQFFEVKIVRLKNGEDLIAFCYEDKKEDKLYIKYPKYFYFGYDSGSDDNEMLFNDWLPTQAYATQEVAIQISDILFISYASVEFGHFYLQEIVDSLDPESDAAKKIVDTIKDMIGEIVPENVAIH